MSLGVDSAGYIGGTNQIANQSVTYAKIQNISSTSRLLGRRTAGAGSTEECTITQALDFVGSAAQGDILFRDAAAWDNLAAGTSGQVLTTQGAGANPTWTTPSGGSVVLISNGQGNTASGSDTAVVTKTFSANDLAANDMLMVVVTFSSSSGFARSKLKITDGGSNTTLNAQTVSDPTAGMVTFYVSQDPQTNTKVNLGSLPMSSASNIPTGANAALSSANWITTAFTLDVIGSNSSGGTSYYNASIYRMKSA